MGIAIGAGTDVAVEAGDVVLVRSDPRDVARLVPLMSLGTIVVSVNAQLLRRARL